MRAVFMRELLGYFRTQTGYIFLSIFIFLFGAQVFTNNILNESFSMSNTFSGMGLACIVLAPLLSMNSIAKERSDQTYLLLCSSPMNTPQIVWGKFLASVAMVGIALAVTTQSVAIVYINSKPYISQILMFYLGFFLLACALIAVGFLVSSLVAKTWTAAGITAAIISLLFILSRTTIKNSTGKNLVALISIYGNINYFNLGILSISSILILVTIIVLLIAISIIFVEKNRNYKRKSLFILLLILILAVSFFFYSAEDKTSMRIDLSGNSLYSLSNQSKDLLNKLQSDIVIYTLYCPGKEPPLVRELVVQYALSERIVTENIDPSENPNFIRNYAPHILGNGEGHVIVSNTDETRFRVFSESELYIMDAKKGLIGSKVESKISSAIDYVDTGLCLRARLLTGHKEPNYSELNVFTSLLDSFNFELDLYDEDVFEPLNAKTDILFVFSPREDLSNDELSDISVFLEQGGRAIFMLDIASYNSSTGKVVKHVSSTPRMDKLLMSYGLQLNRSIVIGTSSPSIRSTTLEMSLAPHAITQGILEGGHKVVLSEAGSIDIHEIDEIKASSILNTSEQCFSKTIDGFSDMQHTPEDVSGSFVVGAIAEKSASSIVLFSTSSIIHDQELSIPGNRALLSNLLNYISWGRARVVVEQKLFDGGEPIEFADAEKSLFAIIMLFVCPSIPLLLWLVVRRIRKHAK